MVEVLVRERGSGLTTMESFIGNIFYFGVPKDGFKVYPDSGAVSNVFAGYSTNTETEWILTAKKTANITNYTHVRYGLLASAVNGRSGSCLGISIDFIDCYFTDLEMLRRHVIEKIWDAFLSDNKLLEIQETSGKVAFKAYNLNEVSQYLETKSQIIREVLTEDHSGNVEPSDSIPDAGSNPIYALHPNSSLPAIQELFETYGIVRLSPSAPVETQSFSQKAAEQVKALQQKNQLLNSQLKQKIDYIEGLKKKPLVSGGPGGGARQVTNMQAAGSTPRHSLMRAANDLCNENERLQDENERFRREVAQNRNEIARLREGRARDVGYSDPISFLETHAGKILIGIGVLVLILLVFLVSNSYSGSHVEPRADTAGNSPASATPEKTSGGALATGLYEYDGKDPEIKSLNGLIITVTKQCNTAKGSILATVSALNPAIEMDRGDLSRTKIDRVAIQFEIPQECSISGEHFKLINYAKGSIPTAQKDSDRSKDREPGSNEPKRKVEQRGRAGVAAPAKAVVPAAKDSANHDTKASSTPAPGNRNLNSTEKKKEGSDKP